MNYDICLNYALSINPQEPLVPADSGASPTSMSPPPPENEIKRKRS
jgi:hypothetical protein